jgi:hypothetical protein
MLLDPPPDEPPLLPPPPPPLGKGVARHSVASTTTSETSLIAINVDANSVYGTTMQSHTMHEDEENNY